MGSMNVKDIAAKGDWKKIRTGITADDDWSAATLATLQGYCIKTQGMFVDFMVEGTWNSKTIDAQVAVVTETPLAGEKGIVLAQGFKDGSDKVTLSADTVLPMCAAAGEYMTLKFSADGGVTAVDVWARTS